MMLFFCLTAGAQKFALVDMEYILNRIPAYERANEQLDQFSKRWQAEVEALNLEAQTLYKNYQNEALFLSEEQKNKKEEEIMAMEKKASELKRQYFGPDGELIKKIDKAAAKGLHSSCEGSQSALPRPRASRADRGSSPRSPELRDCRKRTRRL